MNEVVVVVNKETGEVIGVMKDVLTAAKVIDKLAKDTGFPTETYGMSFHFVLDQEFVQA